MAPLHTVRDERKTLEFHLSEDRLKLFVSATPGPQCAEIQDDEIMQEVAHLAPALLVDADVVKDLTQQLKQGIPSPERRVARGTPAIDGKDGKLVWLVRRYQTIPDPKESESRFADFFHLGLFENVRKGQEIARIYKPKQGKVGIDVLGKNINPKPGRPAQIRIDKSLALTPSNKPEGYDILISGTDGYVREEDGKIAILNVLEIPHNLDYSIGHVDFIGSVVVHGDINKGFNIKARGDITIDGSVVGDNVLVSEGQITVKGFHQGGETAAVFATGGYTVPVAHHVKAQVKGDIVVGKEALDCSFRTTTHLDIRNGTLHGGEVWCVNGVDVKELGNEAGISTRIELRNPQEISEEFASLQLNVKKHETAVATLELHLGPYARQRSRIIHLNGGIKDKLTALIQKYDRVKASLTTLRAQAAVLAGDTAVNQEAKISVGKTLHAGVALVARDSEIVVKNDESGPFTLKFSSQSGEWVKGSYEAIEVKKSEKKRSER